MSFSVAASIVWLALVLCFVASALLRDPDVRWTLKVVAVIAVILIVTTHAADNVYSWIAKL